MAQSKYIQSVKRAAAGRNLSIEWYRKKMQEFGKPNGNQLIQDGKRGSSPFYGLLNMFFYDPKLKEKLKYYDLFPLVLPLEKYRDGFLGINFHYLPIPLRMELLDRLGDFSNNDKFDESTILNISYNRVKNIDLVKPTLHRYLNKQLQSQFRRIDADEFTIATLLPVQRFQKATSRQVWTDSRKMV
tara:strand:+ start:646 stop:1203 length:558 start_codon:yes stop_codon:yes gene_type:complete